MARDPQPLPNFTNPPVTELVMGVQFAPLLGFTGAHFGWYWKKYLDESWVKAVDAPLLLDQFETFGERGWVPPGLASIVNVPPGADRVQFFNARDDRVIQLQRTRFFYNWRKRADEYPKFDRVYAEFRGALGTLNRFLEESEIKEISINQWEISYINHIPKGRLWETAADWHAIFPGLFTPGLSGDVAFETFGGEWHCEIIPRRGRLHVVASMGKVVGKEPELLIVQLTARGPVLPGEPGQDLEAGMNLGHRVLVRAFADLASEHARTFWGME